MIKFLFDLSTIRQLANDIVQGVRGHRGGPTLADLGRGTFNNLDIHIRRVQGQLIFAGIQADV